MGPDGDDGNEHGSGPPPDPTMRAWRHPSEIAAAQAAAARPAPPRRNLSRLALTAGSLVATVVVLGSAVLAISSTVTVQADNPPDSSAFAQQFSSDYPVGTGAAGGPSWAAEPTSTSHGDGSGLIEPAAGVSASAGEVTITSVTASVPMLAGGAPSSSELAAGSRSDPASGSLDLDLLPPPSELGDGVFAVYGSEATRLGLYVAIDGMVLTSASAVEGHEKLALAGGGSWVEAVVVASDPPTDVAVLGVEGTGGGELLDAAGTGQTAGAAPEPRTGTRIEVPIAGASGTDTTAGTVIGTDQRILTQGGIPIYGSLLTTAKRPDGASGAALLDRDGSILGLVVDSAGYLASAVPIDRAVAVARSLTELQVPTTVWLGVEGRTHPGGGAELHRVVAGGPADEAGLRSGDVILEIGGTEVIDWFHLIYLVRQAGAGATLDVELDRSEVKRVVSATVGSRVDVDVDVDVVVVGAGS